MKFRKKPVIIEAVTAASVLADSKLGLVTSPPWISQAFHSGHLGFGSEDAKEYVLILTLEGTMRAEPDDWIVRGLKGELYPVKPDIFAITYDPIYETTEET